MNMHHRIAWHCKTQLFISFVCWSLYMTWFLSTCHFNKSCSCTTFSPCVIYSCLILKTTISIHCCFFLLFSFILQSPLMPLIIWLSEVTAKMVPSWVHSNSAFEGLDESTCKQTGVCSCINLDVSSIGLNLTYTDNHHHWIWIWIDTSQEPPMESYSSRIDCTSVTC